MKSIRKKEHIVSPMNLYIAVMGLLFLFMQSSVFGQKNLSELRWSEVVGSMPNEWYGSDEALRVAGNVLLFQRNVGGWPKNTPIHMPLSESEKQDLLKKKSSLDDVTIDNGGTVMEMIFLAKVFNATQEVMYKDAFLKGLDYLLEAQYDNGGWPQFYPLRKGYYTHITFNDNAMINVLELFQDITQGGKYRFVQDKTVMARVKEALVKGTACILKCQVVQNGKLTAWCAQHDEQTFLPAKARAYELPSVSGSESAGIVLYLMSLENPDKGVIKAVHSAVEWFERVKIEDISIQQFTNSDGKKDRRVVTGKNAEPLWARFYTLEDNRPFFCDRDGIKKYSLEEIGHERRNGYSWYTNAPQKVIDQYKKWAVKFPPDKSMN